MSRGPIESGPRVIRFRYGKQPEGVKKKTPNLRKRGVCKEFTKDVRRRLSVLLASLIEVDVHHVSLTWGKNFPKDAHQVKEIRRIFIQNCSRRGLVGLMILEFQVRGAPHFHVLFIDKFDNTDAEWIRKEWGRRTGNYNSHAVCIREAAISKASWYLALHHSKEQQKTPPEWWQGQWWSYINREEFLKFTKSEEIGYLDGNVKELVWVKRLFWRFTKAKRRQSANARKGTSRGKFDKSHKVNTYNGITWFLKDCEHGRLLHIIRKLADGSGVSQAPDPKETGGKAVPVTLQELYDKVLSEYKQKLL